MRQVNIHEAKTHLSRLIEDVAAGEEIIIAKGGKPVAKLVPIAADVTPRKLGFMRERSGWPMTSMLRFLPKYSLGSTAKPRWNFSWIRTRCFGR